MVGIVVFPFTVASGEVYSPSREPGANFLHVGSPRVIVYLIGVWHVDKVGCHDPIISIEQAHSHAIVYAAPDQSLTVDRQGVSHGIADLARYPKAALGIAERAGIALQE